MLRSAAAFARNLESCRLSGNVGIDVAQPALAMYSGFRAIVSAFASMSRLRCLLCLCVLCALAYVSVQRVATVCSLLFSRLAARVFALACVGVRLVATVRSLLCTRLATAVAGFCFCYWLTNTLQRQDRFKDASRIRDMKEKLKLQKAQLGNLREADEQHRLRDASRTCEIREMHEKLESQESQLNKLKARDTSLCIVCRDRPRSCVLLPCRHNILCKPCASELRFGRTASQGFCPVCRAHISDIIETFV